MSNLGVLTTGAEVAVEYLESKGYEVILFHAVGAGGRAMEQMMREGLIAGVFDYALGEISDELHHALRAGGPERLTVAGKLGLPQVLVPGGSEHIGLFLSEAHVLPEKYKNHMNTFHSPIIAAPRLNPDELVEVAKEIGKRLQHTKGNAVMMLPLRGTSRYGVEGGPLRNPESDKTLLRGDQGEPSEDDRSRRSATWARRPGVRPRMLRSAHRPDRSEEEVIAASKGVGSHLPLESLRRTRSYGC